jgi:hypothetical protein
VLAASRGRRTRRTHSRSDASDGIRSAGTVWGVADRQVTGRSGALDEIRSAGVLVRWTASGSRDAAVVLRTESGGLGWNVISDIALIDVPQWCSGRDPECWKTGAHGRGQGVAAVGLWSGPRSVGRLGFDGPRLARLAAVALRTEPGALDRGVLYAAYGLTPRGVRAHPGGLGRP